MGGTIGGRRRTIARKEKRMVNRSCTTCVYAWWEPGQWLASLSSGFPSRPVCANHPDSPGLMKTVPFGGPCRNYRAKPTAPDLADGTVKRIPLSDGVYAYVDAADYEWLSKYTWHLANGYAARREKGKVILMHCQIMNPPKGKIVDHANHNKLDDTRTNLRNCTRQQNMRNTRKHANASSRFKGVGYSRQHGRWFARIHFGDRTIWLGLFTEELEAARTYDRAAIGYFGEFANVNFPEEWPAERRQEVHAACQAALKKQRKKTRRKEAKKNTRSGKTKIDTKKARATPKAHPARRKTNRRSRIPKVK
jgi:hypothetical protein